MKRLMLAAAAATMALTGVAATSAEARPWHDRGYHHGYNRGYHHGWNRGGYGYNRGWHRGWNRGYGHHRYAYRHHWR